MANLFIDTPTIAQQILDDLKNLTGVQLSLSQLDDDNVIKALTYAGPISAWYAQLQRLSNDTFAQSASTTALQNMLRARNLPPQGQAGPSHLQIQLTATAAAQVTTGITQVQRSSDGAVFTCIQTVAVTAPGSIVAFFESVLDGSASNMDQLNQPFALITPITGINSACTNITLALDGVDEESDAAMAARIIAHDQDENSGGNVAAYIAWAEAASNEVVTATVLRRPRGPDTVDVIITSGTTDISAAVLAGQPVLRLPSGALIATVLAYIQNLNPITDDVQVYGPTEIPLNVTFNYQLYNESVANRAYVDNIITQQIEIYLYSANSGDILTPTAIERLVDQAIGDQIDQRLCLNLGGSTPEYVVPNGNILEPGTITLGVIT